MFTGMTGLLSGAMLLGGAHMGMGPQFNAPQLSQPFGGGFSQNPSIIMLGAPPFGQGLPFGPGNFGPQLQGAMPPGAQGFPAAQGGFGQQFPQQEGASQLPFPQDGKGGFPHGDPQSQDPHHCGHFRGEGDTPDAQHTWTGTVLSVSAPSSNFTLSSHGTSYSVTVTPATTLTDRNGTTLSSISSFQSGDLVDVFGTSSASTIVPSKVVNTSLPR